MSAAIKLSDKLVEQARTTANIYNRSIPKQIEYWSRIGKIAEENPDLPFNFIKGVLFALEDAKEGRIESYSFNTSNS